MLITPEAETPFGCVNPADLSVLERAKLACNTVRLLFPDEVPPTEEDRELARDAFAALVEPDKANNRNKTDVASLAHYPTPALQHLDRMLSQYDYELVNSAVRIREYTKNKLLEESENPDGRIRIRALELLGKIRDVGLFADRVEITHRTKTDAELEQELQQKLEKFMGVIEREDPPVQETIATPVHEQTIDETLLKIGL